MFKADVWGGIGRLKGVKGVVLRTAGEQE